MEVIISGDPCFGACDLKDLPECDTILHFAHSEFGPYEGKKVVYAPYYVDLNCTKVAEKAVKLLEGKDIGLVTTVQHIKELPKVARILEKHGKKVHVGKGAPHDGQVLGCDLNAALSIKDEVDSYLFIGSGNFHPLGVAYYTGKPVIRADPYTKQAEEVDASEWIRGRCLRQTKAMNARRFGIVVSTKPGQKKLPLADAIKSNLEKRGKEAYIISMDNITPDSLLPYNDLDAFVITACPRIVIDDWKNYKKPLLHPKEIKV